MKGPPSRPWPCGTDPRRRPLTGLLPSAIAVGTVVLLAGCGGDSGVIVRAPTAPLPSPTSQASTSPVTPGSGPSVHPTLRVVPATGLHDGQRVRVEATGFSPGESLAVVECASKGNATQAGDCNLTEMMPVVANGAGQVAITVPVRIGPFGANNIRCSATQRCLLSVTQASLSPGQEADALIAFAR